MRNIIIFCFRSHGLFSEIIFWACTFGIRDIANVYSKTHVYSSLNKFFLFCSWLVKRAQGRRKYGLKNFKKRFFRLTNHSLTYARGERRPALCTIAVEDILAVEELQEATFTRKYVS